MKVEIAISEEEVEHMKFQAALEGDPTAWPLYDIRKRILAAIEKQKGK